MATQGTKLSVTVEAVIYPKQGEESSFFVLATDKGKASGTISWRPELGERLSLEGRWGSYRGEKVFKFTAAMLDIPLDPQGKLTYVCERTPGIGDALQKKIWETWGRSWETDASPGVINRLNNALWERFRETLEAVNQEGQMAHVISWLMEQGATMTLASTAWEEWEEQTIGVVQSNPYRLADLSGVGFQQVDQSIRHAFGIEDDDERRIQAGVIYALKKLTEMGSTVVTWQDLQVTAVKCLGGMYRELVVDAVKQMFLDGSLRGFKETQTLALATDFWNENDIWQYAQHTKDEL